MSDANSVTTWLGQLRQGETAAAEQLWARYFARLVVLARTKLIGTSRRAADEEDVALSAFTSFCQAAAANRFPRLDNRDDLWQVLVMLTARKAYQERRRQQARKRGGTRTQTAPPAGDDELATVIGTEPDPGFAALVADEFRHLLGRLPNDDLRQIALLRLENYTPPEIADRLGVSERTVWRKLGLIRGYWEEAELPVRPEADPDSNSP